MRIVKAVLLLSAVAGAVAKHHIEDHEQWAEWIQANDDQTLPNLASRIGETKGPLQKYGFIIEAVMKKLKDKADHQKDDETLAYLLRKEAGQTQPPEITNSIALTTDEANDEYTAKRLMLDILDDLPLIDDASSNSKGSISHSGKKFSPRIIGLGF